MSVIKKKLVIVGAGATAEIAYEYFTYDSEYCVVAFAVEGHLREIDRLFNLPVVDLEVVDNLYSFKDYYFFVAISFTKLNTVRARIYNIVKAKGYRIASYISSKSFIWPNVSLGENCFILENNVIQAFCHIGNNVTLWSGNHIGHHSSVEDNCFISSHVVISGFCKIGKNSFIGVNSSLSDGISLGAGNWVGPSLAITKNTEPNKVFGPNGASPSQVSAKRFFKIDDII